MSDPTPRGRWLAFALGLLALSAISVGVRAYGYPEVVQGALVRALEWFAEPGLAFWWLTIGGVFQAFPADAAGYCVAILGNTVLWLSLFALIAFVVAFIRLKR